MDWRSALGLAAPQAASTARPIGQDELGNWVYEDATGSRYSVGQQPVQMTDAQRNDATLMDLGLLRPDPQTPDLRGAINALAGMFTNGLSAPANALRGDMVTMGDVWDTAGTATLGASAMPAPANALRGLNFNSRPFYHGTPDGRDVRQTGGFSTGKTVFLSDNPSVARTYADPRRAWDYQGAEPEVFRAMTNPQRIVDIDAGGSDFRGINAEAVKRGLLNAGIPEEDAAARVAAAAARRSDGRISTNDLENIVRGLGFDAADISNVRDTYNATAKAPKSVVRMMFNPAQVSVEGLR